jgi:hypothetical protein
MHASAYPARIPIARSAIQTSTALISQQAKV